MSVDLLNQSADWLQNNQSLFIEYFVNIVSALLTLVIGIVIARMVSNALHKIMLKKQVDGIVASFTSNMTKYLILAFVTVAALSRVGIQTASLVAIIGAAGLAIGLALQGSLSNFAAGVLLIIFRPVKKGEFVEVSGVAGSVESVQIFTTVLITPDNKMVVVPNNNVLSNNIINYTRTGQRRIDLVIGVSYSADLKKTRAIIEQVLQSNDKVLKDPAWTIGVLALADSSVNFAVRPWAKSSDYWDVYFSLHENIKMALDEAGIEIPFPQRDVHLIQKEAAA
ncbi:small-conductance mechanosensitive channel MscS [Endozoicomonas elysicola]|uniref:Small-conductance mechanosensitive channel n=1 Tax=Endozoicomonas elysicola TaxID=305900 RepID=A0A081K6L4_9GAMM|nr:small-conductance mechanosensitive channel MscS [Endozoicomonas elysicola]KEI69790.1 mechanosensitive ion channel protein [Endozoicomonas elysicola]